MFTEKELQHIADLARIKLSEKEKEGLKKDLSSILDYINKLNEIDPVRGREGSQRASASNGVDTKNIEPTAQVTGLINVFREDEKPHEIDPEKIKNIIGQAPEREKGFVKTRPILKK